MKPQCCMKYLVLGDEDGELQLTFPGMEILQVVLDCRRYFGENTEVYIQKWLQVNCVDKTTEIKIIS